MVCDFVLRRSTCLNGIQMTVDGEKAAMNQLSINNHDRDASAMRYVYPVVSRRAGGVSVGINLNTNNACNWACVYCQVPGLTRGGPLPVDLLVLERELGTLLDDILKGDFLVRRVPEGMRQLSDVAFSGNGEPTTAEEFPQAVDLVIAAVKRRGMAGQLPLRVITNGSMMHRPAVLSALSRMRECSGEVWFKIDRATEAGIRAVNQTAIKPSQMSSHLKAAADVIPVWVQTCWFGVDHTPPSEEEEASYVQFVAEHRQWIAGIHLYGIARPSMQPAGERLLRLPRDELARLAERLKKIGVIAQISE